MKGPNRRKMSGPAGLGGERLGKKTGRPRPGKKPGFGESELKDGLAKKTLEIILHFEEQGSKFNANMFRREIMDYIMERLPAESGLKAQHKKCVKRVGFLEAILDASKRRNFVRVKRQMAFRIIRWEKEATEMLAKEGVITNEEKEEHLAAMRKEVDSIAELKRNEMARVGAEDAGFYLKTQTAALSMLYEKIFSHGNNTKLFREGLRFAENCAAALRKERKEKGDITWQ